MARSKIAEQVRGKYKHFFPFQIMSRNKNNKIKIKNTPQIDEFLPEKYTPDQDLGLGMYELRGV